MQSDLITYVESVMKEKIGYMTNIYTVKAMNSNKINIIAKEATDQALKDK